MKHEGTAKSIQTMLIRAHTLSLQLKQKYYKTSRIMKIVNDPSGLKTQLYRAADIQGITVDIAPRAGLEREAASRVAQVETDAANGLVPPQAALESRVTGQTQSILEKFSRDRIQQTVKDILNGIPGQVDPDIDAGIALNELENIKRMLSALGITATQQFGVNDLIEKYRSKMQQEQQAMQPAANQVSSQVKPKLLS